jgi:prepilin peptidase CpaA
MHFQHIGLLVFAVVMGIAAFEDFRRLTIPNVLPLVLCAAWPLHLAALPTPGGVFGAIGCALAVFVAGAVLFARGWLGGGDVKLLSAATLWAGAGRTPELLMTTGILGGCLALLLLIPFAEPAVTAARRLLGTAPQPRGSGSGSAAAPLPYGVAIAGAGLIVVVSPHIA